jgi:hypothetical protein
MDAAHANDDGDVDIRDPVTIRQYLFLGSSQIPPPEGEAGFDMTEDESIAQRGLFRALDAEP